MARSFSAMLARWGSKALCRSPRTRLPFRPIIRQGVSTPRRARRPELSVLILRVRTGVGSKTRSFAFRRPRRNASAIIASRKTGPLVQQTWRNDHGLDHANTRRNLHRPRDQRLPAGRVLICIVASLRPVDGALYRHHPRCRGTETMHSSGAVRGQRLAKCDFRPRT